VFMSVSSSASCVLRPTIHTALPLSACRQSEQIVVCLSEKIHSIVKEEVQRNQKKNEEQRGET